MKFLTTVIDLPRHCYTVQTVTPAQVLARLVYIIMVSLDYGFSVSEIGFRVSKTLALVFWKCFGNVLEIVMENVLKILITPESLRYAAMA